MQRGRRTRLTKRREGSYRYGMRDAATRIMTAREGDRDRQKAGGRWTKELCLWYRLGIFMDQ